MQFRRTRLLPFRDRQALLDRRTELIATAIDLDSRERRLAAQMAEVRRELQSLRSVLWPAEPGRAFRKRPPSAGRRTAADPASGPQRGPRARCQPALNAALGVLVRAGIPMPLPEIHRALHLTGFRIAGRHAVKQLADALRLRARARAGPPHRSRHVPIGELPPARRRRASRPGPAPRDYSLATIPAMKLARLGRV